MKILLTATRESDGATLHLIRRGNDYSMTYVVCWHFNEERQDWDWGSYCEQSRAALLVFIQKYVEHGFNDIHEGFITSIPQ